ncbi:MAG: Rrf2 family transcriptional regulator [Acidimicrobiia bacterium]|nr:Rrf2 family transcriptional regulator [Acidimicrobiia bacterium]
MRLEVSRKADLATRTLIELAVSGVRSKSADLAGIVGTTPGFLSQVIAPLATRGWVSSEPGPTGGYAATVDLDEVSVLEVIEAVEGPTDTGRCVLEDRPCGGTETCALHVPWTRARASLLEELADTPLSSLARSRGTAS